MSAYMERVIAWCCIVASVITLLNCSNSNLTGGGNTSETGNTISGEVIDGKGNIVSNASITLYPDSFYPGNNDTLPPGYSVITDENGVYHIKNVPVGVYNLHVQSESGTQVSLSKKIEIDSGALELNPVIKSPGQMVFYLADLDINNVGRLYIPGSPIIQDVDSNSLKVDSITLLQIPPGTISQVNFVKDNTGENISVVIDEIEVISDSMVSVGKKQVPVDSSLPYYNWSESKTIKLNVPDSLLGESVYEFPLLIKLDSSNFNFDSAQSVGEDIRFSNFNKDSIAYEIEMWDSVNQTALIWVFLDSLTADSNTQQIILHHGNSKANDESSGSNVFNPNGQTKAVVHFTPINSNSEFEDVSGEGNHFEPLGALSFENSVPLKNSEMGTGLNLTDSNQFSSGVKFYDNPSLYHYSIWFKTGSDSGGAIVVFTTDPLDTFSISNRVDYDRILWMSDSGNVHYGVFQNWPDSGRHSVKISSANKYNDGKWHLASVNQSTENGMQLYLDGELIGSNVNGNDPANFVGSWKLGNDGNFENGIGSWLGTWPPIPTSPNFVGMMDEFRLYHEVKSDTWIRLSYENQRGGSTLVSLE